MHSVGSPAERRVAVDVAHDDRLRGPDGAVAAVTRFATRSWWRGILAELTRCGFIFVKLDEPKTGPGPGLCEFN